MNSRGQALLETVLLLAVVVIAWTGTNKILRERGVFQKIFGDSWVRLSNVIEFGVPSNSKSDAGPRHPATLRRHSTREGGS